MDLQNYKTVIHKNNLINGAVVSVARTIIGTLTALAPTPSWLYRQQEAFSVQEPALPVLGCHHVCKRRLIPVFLLYKGLGLTNSFCLYCPRHAQRL